MKGKRLRLDPSQCEGQSERIRVRVPATTGNLGPGFDCLGMALDIWNMVEAERSGRPIVSVWGEGQNELPTDESNLVYRSSMRLLEAVGETGLHLHVRCKNNIPLKRGLGSSAAAIVGGMVAANSMVDSPLSQEELLALAVSLEGHADNIAPSLLGGVQIVVSSDERVTTSPVPVPQGLTAVLYIPDMSIDTTAARTVLPKTVARRDVVYNLGRVALLINALATGRWQDLKSGTEDRLHQPAREFLFPAMKVIIHAALEAGALGAFLSGSGSTVLALTQGREVTVAYEMAEAARKANVEGMVKITSPTLRGAHLVEVG